MNCTNCQKECKKTRNKYNNICDDCKTKVNQKMCSKCEITKSLAQFNNDKKGFLGKSFQCKDCKNIERRRIRRCIDCDKELYRNSSKIPHCEECKLKIQKIMCNDCKNFKLLSYFYNKKGGFLGRSAICKDCEIIKNNNHIKTVKGFLKLLLTASKRHVVKKSKNLQHTLTYDHLKNIYIKQQGECYYSGIKMNMGHNLDWKCSIERLDQKIGYIPSNVCLCTLEFNSRHQWSHDKLRHLQSLLTKDNTWIKEIDNLLMSRQIINCTCEPQIKCCNKCRGFQYRNSLRGCIKQLLNASKKNAMDKAEKGRTSGTYDLSYKCIVEKLKEQKGLCAYSNIPLNFTKGDWRMSFERVDTSKGYTNNNVVIIASEFNTTDCSIMAKHFICGSGGWSKLKFQYFVGYYAKKLPKEL